jgi:hypothetical protein
MGVRNIGQLLLKSSHFSTPMDCHDRLPCTVHYIKACVFNRKFNPPTLSNSHPHLTIAALWAWLATALMWPLIIIHTTSRSQYLPKTFVASSSSAIALLLNPHQQMKTHHRPISRRWLDGERHQAYQTLFHSQLHQLWTILAEPKTPGAAIPSSTMSASSSSITPRRTHHSK